MKVNPSMFVGCTDTAVLEAVYVSSTEYGNVSQPVAFGPQWGQERQSGGGDGYEAVRISLRSKTKKSYPTSFPFKVKNFLSTSQNMHTQIKYLDLAWLALIFFFFDSKCKGVVKMSDFQEGAVNLTRWRNIELQ